MNILLTSAGRRTYIVRYFREALQDGGLVYASNSAESPALEEADGYFITPLIYSDSYIPFLLEKCRELRIDLLVSLFDVDLPVLSMHRAEFEDIGTFVAVSGPETVSAARDKLLLKEKLTASSIATPAVFGSFEETCEAIRDGRLGYPVIVKPRYGMGSIGLFKAYNSEELSAAFSMAGRIAEESYLSFESRQAGPGRTVIAEEFADGIEYGLDIVADFDGRFMTAFLRKKIAMRSGETDEAIVLGPDDSDYERLFELSRDISAALPHIGLIDVDVKGGSVIDINARIGGGYPFSHLAGADVPGAYILLAEGKRDEAMAHLEVSPGTHGFKDIVPRKYEL